MADVVRLAIVYETSQAAANLTNLNRVAGTSATSFKKAGLAALYLAQGMDVGSISAVGMASHLGRIASILLGPWGIALSLAIGLLTLFKNNQDKAREATIKYGEQLRQVSRAVDDLFRTKPKSTFESEVDHITDLMIELQLQIAKTHRSWLGMASDFIGQVGIHVMTPFGPLNIGGKGIKDSPEEIELRRLQRQRARLTPENELAAARGRQGFARGLSHGLSGLFDITQSDRLSRSLDLAKKQLEELVTLGLDPMSEEARSAAKGIRELEDQLRRAQRAENLFRSGLQTMADAVEEFVVRGTFAFTDFLNNILRLLYRDFTGELIHGFTQSVFHAGGRGGGSAGIQTTGSAGGIGGPMGSVTSNVNFNIQTMDARGVADFIQTHGATIAAEVTRQAGRSGGMRRALRRG